VNLLRNFFGNGPRYIVIVLLVLAFVFGSHAALDILVASLGDACVPMDASTSVCLVNTAE